MVRHPGEYRWSSYADNALKLGKFPIRPHETWLALGSDAKVRRARYRNLFDETVNPKDVEAIRFATRKGLPTGSDRFKQEIETALGRKISNGRRGRPRKGL
jgi:putative transposase